MQGPPLARMTTASASLGVDQRAQDAARDMSASA